MKDGQLTLSRHRCINEAPWHCGVPPKDPRFTASGLHKKKKAAQERFQLKLYRASNVFCGEGRGGGSK